MGKAGTWVLGASDSTVSTMKSEGGERYDIKEDCFGDNDSKKDNQPTEKADQEYSLNSSQSSSSICTQENFLDCLSDWVSLSGIKQCCDDEVPIWWRFIWIFIITIGIAFSVFQIVTQIITFRGWPIRAKIEITSMENMDFPPIVICNFNPVRKSILEKHNLTSLIPLYSRQTRDIYKRSLRQNEDVLEGLHLTKRSTNLENSQEFKAKDWELLYKDFAHSLDDMLLHVNIISCSIVLIDRP